MANGTVELLKSLKIDPEFRDKIPPLTDAEFQQLRENILDAGEVYDPIRVWNGTVVDGHNRLKVVQDNPDIKWQTRDMDFADKWAAFDWMYRNQLGRRNLTDEQRTFMIGKMYEARKKSLGGDRRSNEFSNTQNGNLKNNKQGTAGEIARELGIGNNTVIRAEKFANGIDVLRKLTGDDAADKVLSGKSKATKAQISKLGDLASESSEQVAMEVPAVAEAILKDEALPAITQPSKQNKQKKAQSVMQQTSTMADSYFDGLFNKSESVKQHAGDAKTRELYRTLDKAYAPMLDVGAKSNYNLEDLSREIREAGEMFVNSFCGTLDDRKYLLDNDAAWNVVKTAIADIVNDIQDGITRMKDGMTR